MQFFAAAICLISFGQTAVFAQGKDHNQTQTKPKTFIDRAIEMNHAEIEIAKLANTKAQDNRVKNYAEKITRDHTQALHRLHDVSTAGYQGERQLNQTSPETDQPSSQTAMREKPSAMTDTDPSMLTREHQQILDRLSKLSGREFDKSFMDVMVREHRKGVELFERETNTPIARELLPSMRQHLAEAEQIQKQLKH
jgi:putative membrane protein